jgi:hypothetical protein
VQVADETGGAVRPRVAVPALEDDGVDVADVVVPRRKVRTGPLHLHAIDEIEDKPALETRLPLLILLGLGILVAVQVFLTF